MFTVFVILGCNFSANADPLSTPAKDDSGIVWALHDSEDDVWKCITCQTKKGVLYKIELSPNMKDWTSMAEVYGLGQRFSWNLFALNPVPNAIPAELSPVPVSLVAQNIITEGANGGVWLHWKSLDTGEMIHHIASDLSIVPQWGKGDTSTNIEGAYLFSVMNSGTVEAANAFSSDLGTKDSAMMTELRSKWSSLNQAIPQNIASSVSANIPPVNSTQMFYRIVSDETLDSDGDGIPDVDEFNESGNGSSGNGGGGVNPFFPQEPTVKLVGRSVSKTENDEDFEDFNSAPTSVPNSYFPANDTEGWSSSFLYPYRSRTHVWAVEMDDSALLNSERVDFIDSAATIKTQMRITINSAYIRDIVREYEYVISESVNQENDSADTHTTYPQKAVVSFIIPAGELTSSIKELVIPDEGIENIPAPVYAPERYQGELQASGGVIGSSLYADMLVSKYREILRLELVPDWNRDGKINRADRNKVTAQNPWHWWINDDDDFEVVERGENANDIPGQPANLRDCNDLVVDGMRDFIDFFPLHLDIKKALASLPTAQYRYVLKHEESALKFFEYPGCDISGNSEQTGPNFYIKDNNLARVHRAKALKEISAEGVELSENMMLAAENGRGVIMIEGAKSTGKPLRLEIIKKADDSVVTSLELSLKLAEVETMFRVINFRSIYDDERGLDTQKKEPSGYPDTYTNGKYFAYIHGYNVDGQSARGSQSNIFKRMHQLGSKARFIGIYWNGTPPMPALDSKYDYHRAVYNGFLTGEQLKDKLSFVGDSSLTIMAHSLGNIPVSHAIANAGLTVDQYYMIDAAVPIEAYDATQISNSNEDTTENENMPRRMTENNWKSFYDYQNNNGEHSGRRLFAAHWYQLFDEADNRSKLTWKNIFAKPELLSVAYNFYSTGEEVVENADETESFGGNIITYGFVRHAWIQQEMAKGGQNAAAPPTFHDLNGGWVFAKNYGETFSGGNSSHYNYLRAHETDHITNEELKTKPFYQPFLYPELYDPAQGSATAGDDHKRYKVLATGVPAMSYAAAANKIDKFDLENPGEDRNFNMQHIFKSMSGEGSWPELDDEHPFDWGHSDFKDVSLQFVYPMYEKMIELGNLNQN